MARTTIQSCKTAQGHSGFISVVRANPAGLAFCGYDKKAFATRNSSQNAQKGNTPPSDQDHPERLRYVESHAIGLQTG